MRFYILIILFISPLQAFALMNGKPLVGLPDVVRLKFKNGWVCSGVYIDRRTILTAAHCLVIPESKKLIELEQVLTIGDSELAVKEVKSIVHPLYEAQSWSALILILLLNTSNS